MSFWAPSKHWKSILFMKDFIKAFNNISFFPPSLKVIVHRFNCSQRHGLLRPSWIFQCHGFMQLHPQLFSEVWIIYCSLTLILKWFRNKSERFVWTSCKHSWWILYFTNFEKRFVWTKTTATPSNVLPWLNCTFLTKQIMAFYTNKSAPGFLLLWTLYFFS